jgi:hypothetical protein
LDGFGKSGGGLRMGDEKPIEFNVFSSADTAIEIALDQIVESVGFFHR